MGMRQTVCRPFVGNVFAQPLSRSTASRFGPRHCGQSSAMTELATNSVINRTPRRTAVIQGAIIRGLPLASMTSLALLQRRFGALFHVRGELVARDDAGAGVPAEERVVIAGGAKSFGAFVGFHSVVQKFERARP